MTRKHFQMIADILSNFNVDNLVNQSEVTAMIAETYARELKQHNPRFDKERFLTACGVE